MTIAVCSAVELAKMPVESVDAVVVAAAAEATSISAEMSTEAAVMLIMTELD